MFNLNHKLLKYSLILAIFLLCIYIGNQITFFNNDDWVHYKTVENFLGGNFHLHPYIGSTFYTQGFLAYAFAKLFGPQRLPVLTILISVINIFVFYKILNLIYIKNFWMKLFSVLLFAINPLYLYSSIGFMTENYVILFVLLGIYFHIRFQNTNQIQNVFFTNIAYILGFFVKHYSVFLNFASMAYFIVKRMWTPFIISAVFTFSLLFFYYFWFPKNEVLSNQSFNIDLADLPQLIFNIFLYLSFFTLPLSLFLIFQLKTHRLLTAILFGLIFYATFKILVVEDFPGLTNVITRKGLFPSLDGNKSHWAGYLKFFTYASYISVVFSSLLIAKVILSAKYIFIRTKFLSIAFILYFGLCLILPFFYDRYLLPLLIIWILISYKLLSKFIPSRLGIFICTIWMIIYGFFTYLYITDYVVRSIAITKSTNELIAQGVDIKTISSDRSWNNFHEVNEAKYIFSYDNPETFDELSNFTLEKTLIVKFPLNIFVNKEIYLYRNND